MRPRQPANAADASCHRSARAGCATAVASVCSLPLVLTSSPTSAAPTGWQRFKQAHDIGRADRAGLCSAQTGVETRAYISRSACGTGTPNCKAHGQAAWQPHNATLRWDASHISRVLACLASLRQDLRLERFHRGVWIRSCGADASLWASPRRRVQGDARGQSDA